MVPAPIAPTPDDDRTVIIERHRHWDHQVNHRARFASSHGAHIQQSRSCVVRITGVAFGYSHDTTIEVCATWNDFAPVAFA
jgi:hypothetical protein